MSDTISAQGSSSSEGGPWAPSLAEQLEALFTGLVDLFETVDVAGMSGEDLGKEVLAFLTSTKDEINQNGERSYVARRSALFILESLSMALRRGLDPSQVPEEHAAIISTAIDRMTTTRSGLHGSPDVQQLHDIEKTGLDFMKQALLESGLVRKVHLPY